MNKKVKNKPSEEKLKRKRARFLAKGIKFWLYLYALVMPASLVIVYIAVELTPIKTFVELSKGILSFISSPPAMVGIMSIFPVIYVAYMWFDLTKCDDFDKLSKEKRKALSNRFIKKNFIQILMASYISAALSFFIFWSFPEDKVKVASMVVEHGRDVVTQMIIEYEKGITVPPPVIPYPPVYTPPPVQ